MIAIIDYGLENNGSLLETLKKLGAEAKITSQEIEICKADKIILAGKQDAVTVIKKLHKCNLFSTFRLVKKPFLGIGVGAQLLCDHIAEGNIPALGVISPAAEKFEDPAGHTGLYKINKIKESPLLKNIDLNAAEFYFTGSFYIPENEFTTSVALNGNLHSASVEKGSIFGIQFYPEESGEMGSQVLKNFIEL
ncbi:MAG TPA: imidazole glycerol phosphate synthase subunit HisH [Ignavibacteriales bacterium]|nr:imidazole glycerol phosphate synthase subunit HisH [Ignavibacteriales bacterium]